MMRQFFIVTLVVLLLSSCTSNTIFKKPKDLIPPEVMVNLFTDIYIANAARNIPNKINGHNAQYLPLVYKKYKIDSLRFNTSNVYYLSRIKEYKSIQERALKNLEILQKKYKKISDKIDSINRIKMDSIRKRKPKIKPPRKLLKNIKLKKQRSLK